MTDSPWDKIEANVDYGAVAGYFVRLDVDLWRGGSMSLSLSIDEARALARDIIAAADGAAQNQEKLK